jgi:hypothetical protein
MARRHAPNLAPRMLDKGQAAAYCGMCPAMFDALCPVGPVEYKPGMKRFDRVALDAWLDGLSTSPATVGSLASRYDDRHSRARPGN